MLFSIANSFCLNSMFEVKVLKIFVIPIKVIIAINLAEEWGVLAKVTYEG